MAIRQIFMQDRIDKIESSNFPKWLESKRKSRLEAFGILENKLRKAFDNYCGNSSMQLKNLIEAVVEAWYPYWKKSLEYHKNLWLWADKIWNRKKFPPIIPLAYFPKIEDRLAQDFKLWDNHNKQMLADVFARSNSKKLHKLLVETILSDDFTNYNKPWAALDYQLCLIMSIENALRFFGTVKQNPLAADDLEQIYNWLSVEWDFSKYILANHRLLFNTMYDALTRLIECINSLDKNGKKRFSYILEKENSRISELELA